MKFITHYNFDRDSIKPEKNSGILLTKPDQALTILDLFERHTRRVDEIPHRNGIFTDDFTPPSFSDKAEQAEYLLELQSRKAELTDEILLINKQIQDDNRRKREGKYNLQNSNQDTVQEVEESTDPD